MSKYQFHRLGSTSFQEMVQSLLETKHRNAGELIQFGAAGADGAREATWRQSPNHPEYIRPENSLTDAPKHWVFQVKFHDIGLRGWAGAGAAVVADLKVELEKITTKYEIACDHYVLITNVPLTGASLIGTRDKVTKTAHDWKAKIPNIEVWDAADLSRMLDNNPEIRTAYSELILPGDILNAMHRQLAHNENRRESCFRGYLKHLVDNESKARSEEAGDDDPLPLSKIFVDQTLQLEKQSIPDCYRELIATWELESNCSHDSQTILPEDFDEVSSGFPFLWGSHQKIMLLAGPGYGKSTITQFLALYHAARIMDPSVATSLASRLKLPPNWTPADLDASSTLRYPFRVELRRYIKWRKLQSDGNIPVGIASYIARQLIGGAVESSLTQDDIFSLVSSNPTLLILDGLDEVPNKDDRDEILKDCDAFLNRCYGEGVDLQVVMSSRPQGYHGEFDRFQPLRWVINELNENDFYSYAADWLSERIKNTEERVEADDRIKRGMKSDAVRRLATTLLQATVMLSIVRKKSDIPEERHKLFEKYVEVVFQREKTKSDLIARYETELKLLHEMVGYQIHEGVARGENGVMPEEKFKDLVWDVWRLVKGDEQVQGIPNQEIQHIYNLSTDRLLFLSGKGANQADIDFVIQPYREYFAANYISNHMEADPERAFSCLVARGAYWQQVLRFYSAIAKPAQQMAWAYGAISSHRGELQIDELVNELPTRRAVIFALPEFGRFRFEQLCKTIEGCMPEQEWWTWLGQDWVIPIIANLRTVNAWRELWKTFKQITKPSFGNRMFALWLFPHVIPFTSAEHSEFVSFISETLSDPTLCYKAIEIILTKELAIDLELAEEEALFKVLRVLVYSGHWRHSDGVTQIIKRLPSNRKLRFFCTLNSIYSEVKGINSVFEFMEFPVEFNPRESIEFDQVGGSLMTITSPKWLEFSIQGQELLCFDEQPETQDRYAAYLKALFLALQTPDDPLLYEQVRAAISILPEEVSWMLHYKSVLGPSPEEFDSQEQWQHYKAEMRYLFSKDGESMLPHELASTFSNSASTPKNGWTVFLFPPRQWDTLVTEELVEASFVSALRETRWAKTVALPKGFIELSRILPNYFLDYLPSVDIPFLKLMRIAVTLHNKGDLYESQIINNIVTTINFANITAGELHNIIKEIQNPSNFPESWARLIIGVALRIEDVDPILLSGFWRMVNSKRAESIWLQMMPQSNTDNLHKFASELLKINDDTSLSLVTHILSHFRDIPSELSLEMNRRAISQLYNCELHSDQIRTLIRCLLLNRPTLEEAKLYSEPQIFNKIISSSFHAKDQIVTRLRAMPQAIPKAAFSSLQLVLKQLLSHKDEYPPDICAAAFDALIQLDVLTLRPLEEVDWQRT